MNLALHADSSPTTNLKIKYLENNLNGIKQEN